MLTVSRLADLTMLPPSHCHSALPQLTYPVTYTVLALCVPAWLVDRYSTQVQEVNYYSPTPPIPFPGKNQGNHTSYTALWVGIGEKELHPLPPRPQSHLVSFLNHKHDTAPSDRWLLTLT